MNAFVRFIPLLLFALAWETSVRLGLTLRLLPSLEAIGYAWIDLLKSGDLLHHGLASVQNLFLGLALSTIAGVTIGVAMARYPVFEALISPLVKSLYPIPKAALVPVFIMWLGLSNASKIASIFMGCLMPLVVSSYNGARGVDRMLMWSAASSGARPWQITFDVVLPAALPDILAGMRNALALSFILLVAAELLIGGRGLGYLIAFLGDGGHYAGMFACVGTVSAAGFLADRIFLIVMRRLLAWR